MFFVTKKTYQSLIAAVFVHKSFVDNDSSNWVISSLIISK